MSYGIIAELLDANVVYGPVKTGVVDHVVYEVEKGAKQGGFSRLYNELSRIRYPVCWVRTVTCHTEAWASIRIKEVENCNIEEVLRGLQCE